MIDRTGLFFCFGGGGGPGMICLFNLSTIKDLLENSSVNSKFKGTNSTMETKINACVKFIKDPSNKPIVIGSVIAVGAVGFLYFTFNPFSNVATSSTKNKSNSNNNNNNSTTSATPLKSPITTNNNNNITISPPTSTLKNTGSLSSKILIEYLQLYTIQLNKETTQQRLHQALLLSDTNQNYHNLLNEMVAEELWVCLEVDPVFGQSELVKTKNICDETIGQAIKEMDIAKQKAKLSVLLGPQLEEYMQHKVRYGVLLRKYSEEYGAEQAEQTEPNRLAKLKAIAKKIHKDFRAIKESRLNLSERDKLLAEMSYTDNEIKTIARAERQQYNKNRKNQALTVARTVEKANRTAEKSNRK